jgi:signal transduction histidine kinase
MPDRKTRSLRTAVLRVFAASFAGTAAILAALLGTVWVSGKSLIADANDTIGKNAAAAVSRLLEEPATAISALVIGLGSLSEGTAPEQASYLEAQRRVFGYFEALLLLDERGRAAVAVPRAESAAGLDFSRTLFFKDALAHGTGSVGWYAVPFSLGTSKNSVVLAAAAGNAAGSGGFVLAGVLDLAFLAQAFPRTELGAGSYLAVVDDRGTFIVHPERALVEQRASATDYLLARAGGLDDGETFGANLEGRRFLVSAYPIASSGWSILLYRAEDKLTEPVRRYLVALLALFVLAAAFGALGVQLSLARVDASFREFLSFTDKVADGDYAVDFRSDGFSEFTELARNFDTMRDRVRERERELERRVEERTAELAKTIETLERAQASVVQAEKVAALGQLAANIAHELNSPLGAVISGSETAERSIQDALDRISVLVAGGGREPLEQALRMAAACDQEPLGYRARKNAAAELERALAAEGISEAEELASRLALYGLFIDPKDYARLLAAPSAAAWIELAGDIAAFRRTNGVIKQAAGSAARRIEALGLFSGIRAGGAMREARLKDTVEDALIIYRNQLRGGIDLQLFLPDLDPIECYPENLVHLWSILIKNALHAMNYAGSLRVALAQEGGQQLVSFANDGPPMDEEVRRKLFTPFFTTKRAGEGAGMGLAVAKRIAEQHGGSIEFSSEESETVFTVRLAVR